MNFLKRIFFPSQYIISCYQKAFDEHKKNNFSLINTLPNPIITTQPTKEGDFVIILNTDDTSICTEYTDTKTLKVFVPKTFNSLDITKNAHDITKEILYYIEYEIGKIHKIRKNYQDYLYKIYKDDFITWIGSEKKNRNPLLKLKGLLPDKILDESKTIDAVSKKVLQNIYHDIQHDYYNQTNKDALFSEHAYHIAELNTQNPYQNLVNTQYTQDSLESFSFITEDIHHIPPEKSHTKRNLGPFLICNTAGPIRIYPLTENGKFHPLYSEDTESVNTILYEDVFLNQEGTLERKLKTLCLNLGRTPPHASKHMNRLFSAPEV